MVDGGAHVGRGGVVNDPHGGLGGVAQHGDGGLGRAGARAGIAELGGVGIEIRVPLAGPLVRLGARAMVGKETARSVLADSPETIKKRIEEYAAAGVNEVVFSLRAPFDDDLLRRVASEIVPHFQ